MNYGVRIDLARAVKWNARYNEYANRFEGLSLPQIAAMANVELVFTTDVELSRWEPGRIVINSVLEPDVQRRAAITELACLEWERVGVVSDREDA